MRRFTWHVVVLTTLVFSGPAQAKSDGPRCGRGALRPCDGTVE